MLTETNNCETRKWNKQVRHLVAPQETHLAHIWTRWQQCTMNSHCYKSTSSSLTSLHGPTRIRRGGVPSKFHQTAGGAPYLGEKNYRKKREKGKPLQTEEQQIRREIGNRVFVTKNSRGRAWNYVFLSCLILRYTTGLGFEPSMLPTWSSGKVLQRATVECASRRSQGLFGLFFCLRQLARLL